MGSARTIVLRQQDQGDTEFIMKTLAEKFNFVPIEPDISEVSRP